MKMFGKTKCKYACLGGTPSSQKIVGSGKSGNEDARQPSCANAVTSCSVLFSCFLYLSHCSSFSVQQQLLLLLNLAGELRN